jgi:hypothetical protein
MLKKFLPESPDKYLNTSADLPLARFGHINQLVNAINTLEESSGNGTIQSIVEGDNISIDNTDPANPIISADIPEVTGFIRSVSGDSIISVDDSDPENITLSATITGFIPLSGTGSDRITGNIEYQEIVDGTSSDFSISRKENNLLNQTGSLVFDNFGRVIMRSKYTDSSPSVYRSEIKVYGGNNTESGYALTAWNASNQFTTIGSSATQNYILVNSTIPNFKGIRYDDDYSSDYSSDSLITRKDAPQIITGSTSPATTPNKIGDIYINTSIPTIYISTGISSSSDWKQVF